MTGSSANQLQQQQNAVKRSRTFEPVGAINNTNVFQHHLQKRLNFFPILQMPPPQQTPTLTPTESNLYNNFVAYLDGYRGAKCSSPGSIVDNYITYSPETIDETLAPEQKNRIKAALIAKYHDWHAKQQS